MHVGNERDSNKTHFLENEHKDFEIAKDQTEALWQAQ
jgi:hypothetical protein